MTVNISKLSGSFLMTQVSVSKTGNSQNMSSDSTSFSSFLKSESNNNAKPNEITSKNDVKDNTKFEGRPQTNKAGENVKKSETEKTTDNADEMVNEAAENVYNEIKETTEVSDEELDEAMEILGLTMIDLLKPENVTAVFNQVMEINDPSALLTNEELSNDLSNLLEATGEITDGLLEELGMTKDEFDSALLSIANNSENVNATADEFVAKENDEEEKDSLIVEVKDSRSAEEKAVSASEDTIKTTEQTTDVTPEKKERATDNHHEHATFAGNQQNNTELYAEVKEDVSLESYISSSSTEEIVKQIVSQIKVNITQSATSMQMELHPASLGHVALTIESKAGVITAQFSAQNEVVKEAIESQIAELRENIESQGIKVEAVEVTVASHEFEQNLQQNNQEAKQQQEEAARVARAGRRIRLNLTDAVEDEELSEEERITKEMMEENGNTVDFTA